VLFRIEPENFAAAQARAVADLEQSEANLALAEIEIERDTKLLASETIAQSRYDATKATRDAEAAIVEAKRADLRQAELNLTYTEIAAPFDGRIGKTHFSVGDVVGPASGPLASLVRVSPVYVGFSLSEGKFFNAMERTDGQARKALNRENSPPVRLRLPNNEVFDETGWLVFVDNRVDPATGTIALRAQFDNARGFLVPGTFVNVEIDSKEAATKLLVPQAAVQRDQKGDFVLVVGADGLVEQRHITTGQQVETDFVVEDGLQEGESVIVEGLQRVRPGVPVKTIGATGQGG
jgi:RND family efflux transporter MFP subunit